LKIIFAFGESDPVDRDITSVNYHGLSRGMKVASSIQLCQSSQCISNIDAGQSTYSLSLVGIKKLTCQIVL